MANDGDGKTPWAFVAHKDGYWLGVTAVDLKEVGRTLSSWAKRGCTITTVHSRAEYNALMAPLKFWPKGGPPSQNPGDAAPESGP